MIPYANPTAAYSKEIGTLKDSLVDTDTITKDVFRYAEAEKNLYKNLESYDDYGTEDFKLQRVKNVDARRIKEYLKDTTAEVPDRKELNELLKRSYGVLCINKRTHKICGVIVTYITAERNVIAYFYVDEILRRKPIVREMFKAVTKNFSNDLPTYIKSKDISTFKNSVKKVENEEDLYLWVKETPWGVL